MDFLAVQTSIGPLTFVGRLPAGPKKPVLLVVGGSFPPKAYLHEFADNFGGINVLIMALPGMNGTPWLDLPLDTLASGLDEALDRLVPDTPMVAFGTSTGNLLTLSLRHPDICRRVIDEPFFQTKDLWPFIPDARQRLMIPDQHPMVQPYLWTYFGIGPDRLENRDYRHLLDAITVPTDVFVGARPLLPPRELDFWPSFTSDEERALLAANPLVTVHVGPEETGHSVSSTRAGRKVLLEIIYAALLDAATRC
jgi:hypothetical protein